MKRGHHETDSNGRWQPRAKPSPKAACTTPDSNSIFCDDAYQHVVLLSWRPVARPNLESDSGDARPFENLAFALFQIPPTRETNLSLLLAWPRVCRRPSRFWRCTASGSGGLFELARCRKGAAILRLTCFRYARVSSPAADFDRRLLVIGGAIHLSAALCFFYLV